MKKIYLLSLMLVFILCSHAQVAATYIFSQSNGTYTPITTGTVFGSSTSDDERFIDPAVPSGGTTLTGPGIPIGFNFTYNGEVFDRIAINYNGWISLGKSSLTPSVDITSTSSYTSLSSTATNTPASLRNRIAGFNRDMQGTATSELRVATIGTGTAQTLVVQWSNVQAYGTTNAGDLYNFQIRLQQTTNTVSVVYGSFTRASTTAITAQVGLGGSTATDFNNRTTTTSWASSTAGTTNAATMSLSSAVLPTSGLTYIWTATSCFPPTLSSLQFTATAIPNASISWGAVTGAASYEYAITTSSTPPASGTNTTTTTASASGLPAGSVIFAHVRTNCGSGSFSSWTSRAYLPCVTLLSPSNGATNVSIPPTYNWTTITGATAYQLSISKDNGATYPATGQVIFTAPPTSNTNPAFYDANTAYKWYVRAIYGADSSSTTCAASNAFSFTTAASPANDSCGAPVNITPYNSPLSGTTVGATQSLAPVTCSTYTSTAPVRDVWYRVAALQNGPINITVTGSSSFDGVLSAYSGTCGNLGTEITCADATVSGGVESLSIAAATAGSVYLIRVYSYGGNAAGTFSIVAGGTALPVTGITLSALRNGSKTQLSWQTLTEINNAGFELQRSADGRYFTGIATIASKANGGNSTAAINYNIDDAKPFSGANYYRLKQTDKDGKISYSNIVYLKGVAVSSLTLSAVYPNPANDVLKAAIQSPAAESITFVITDMMGKTISRQVSAVVSGDNTVNINVASLPSGSYLLKATCRNSCETAYQKFTKQ